MEPNKGGRPTKLTDEVLAKAEKYLDEIEGRFLTVKKGMDAEGNTKWEQTAPVLPNHARLALVCGINKDTLQEWAKAHDSDDEGMKARRTRFSVVITRVRDLQEAMLSENGAAGIYNPAVANRILAARHGYHDKVDTDHTSGGRPIPILASIQQDAKPLPQPDADLLLSPQ